MIDGIVDSDEPGGGRVEEGRAYVPLPVPYNRVEDSAKRAKYRKTSYSLLRALTGDRPDLNGSPYTVDLGHSFAEAVAMPHDLFPTQDEWETVNDITDVDELDGMTDGQQRRSEDYKRFREITGTWRSRGVGDVRALYFFAVLATDDFGSNGEDPLRMGGFPPTPHGWIGRRLVPRDGHRIGPCAFEWLAYDAYLTEGLKHLGIEWLDVEDAVTGAFVSALPMPYRVFLNGQDIPRSLCFLLWRHDFERWQAVAPYAVAVVKKADALIEALRNVPHAPLRGTGVEDVPALLARLRQTMTIPEWADAAKWRLRDFGKINPPTVRPVYRAIADTLAEKIGCLSRSISPPPGAPDFAHRLFNSMAGGGGENGRQSREFLCLVADLVFHLAVARGYPTNYSWNGHPQIQTFHDWKNVRYLLADPE
ncbi:MAG: hypothetical protein H7145_02005 [Akkermansiaceae bacterium]|nr:hypothetical protein [Armatimonadota bacterium]